MTTNLKDSNYGNYISTCANEFIPRAMNFQVAPASALGMVASTQVWHRFLAFLVYIHITG